MKNTKTKILLIASGLILLSVGTGILVWPHAFYESNGTILGNGASLLSEVRANGGLLFGCGIIIFIAAILNVYQWQALALSALVFITFGIARLASMAIDGIPSTSLVLSTGIELLVGILCVLEMRRHRINNFV